MAFVFRTPTKRVSTFDLDSDPDGVDLITPEKRIKQEVAAPKWMTRTSIELSSDDDDDDDDGIPARQPDRADSLVEE